MPAQHRTERAAERGVVQRVVHRLHDYLAPDEGEAHLAAVGDLHGLREVPRDQDSETATEPLHAPDVPNLSRGCRGTVRTMAMWTRVPYAGVS